jgi:hypothetical protein
MGENNRAYAFAHPVGRVSKARRIFIGRTAKLSAL